jgi:hypothetical protein
MAELTREVAKHNAAVDTLRPTSMPEFLAA